MRVCDFQAGSSQEENRSPIRVPGESEQGKRKEESVADIQLKLPIKRP